LEICKKEGRGREEMVPRINDRGERERKGAKSLIFNFSSEARKKRAQGIRNERRTFCRKKGKEEGGWWRN
jgi:hypothetical protein